MKKYNIPVEATLEVIGKMESCYSLSLNERYKENE